MEKPDPSRVSTLIAHTFGDAHYKVIATLKDETSARSRRSRPSSWIWPTCLASNKGQCAARFLPRHP